MAKKENNTVKIKVKETFLDKFDTKVRYTPGQELDFDAERAKDVTDRGLAEYAEPLG